jgi:ParB family chromosome partitioning protein
MVPTKDATMAKRKRLTPAVPNVLGTEQPALETKSFVNGWEGGRRAPIADVAGDTATQAAFDEVASELSSARREGRLIQRLPIDRIDETYLVRDRIVQDDADMDALMASLRMRGQQTPIEVIALDGGHYGLISGWRRLTAIKRLRAEGAEGAFDHIQGLIRSHEEASDAYVAMVEENEIRASLSFYERARIAARAAEQGAYPTARHAVKGLFANASSAKRSKINSFLVIYAKLDFVLRFPAALSEKQGLTLVKALSEDESTVVRIMDTLKATAPRDAESEQKALAEALKAQTLHMSHKTQPKPSKMVALNPTKGVEMTVTNNQITLSGCGVTSSLSQDLQAWLASRDS